MSSISILASPRRGSRPRTGLAVVVVEPLHVIRAALALLISKEPDMEVVLEADTAQGAMDGLRNVATRSSLIVLISVAVHGERDAFWLMRAIRDTFPTFIVLGMGPEVDEMTVSRSL